MSHIKGIHHAAIKCCGREKYEETLRFYEEVLGLTVYSESPNNTMIDTGRGLLEIFDNGTNEPGEGVWRHVALVCDDVDAVVKAVREAGYPVTMEPKDIPMPARIAFIAGPNGESIELFDVKQ